MRVRIKQQDSFNINRIEAHTTIDNIVVEENLLRPEKESIAIFFRGSDASGIINLTTKEFESLVESIKPFMHLIKPITLSTQTKKKSATGKKPTKSKKK